MVVGVLLAVGLAAVPADSLGGAGGLAAAVDAGIVTDGALAVLPDVTRFRYHHLAAAIVLLLVLVGGLCPLERTAVVVGVLFAVGLAAVPADGLGGAGGLAAAVDAI